MRKRAAPIPEDPFVTVDTGPEGGVRFHPENAIRYARDRIAEHASEQLVSLGDTVNERIADAVQDNMGSILAAVGVGAGGALLYGAYRKKRLARSPASKPAEALVKDATYTLQIVVDPRDPTWHTGFQVAAGAHAIRAVFERLGWELPVNGRPPQIRGDDDEQRLAAGETHEWVWRAVWRRAETFLSVKPAFVTTIRAYGGA